METKKKMLKKKISNKKNDYLVVEVCERFSAASFPSDEELKSAKENTWSW